MVFKRAVQHAQIILRPRPGIYYVRRRASGSVQLMRCRSWTWRSARPARAACGGLTTFREIPPA